MRRRLGLIFPEGVADRSRLTRELAARTVVTFLFVRAYVEDARARAERALVVARNRNADDRRMDALATSVRELSEVGRRLRQRALFVVPERGGE